MPSYVHRAMDTIDRIITRKKFVGCVPLTIGTFIIISLIFFVDLTTLKIILLNHNTSDDWFLLQDYHAFHVIFVVLELILCLPVIFSRRNPPRPCQPFDCSTPTDWSLGLMAYYQIPIIILIIVMYVHGLILHIQKSTYNVCIFVTISTVIIVCCRAYAAIILYSFAKFVKNHERVTVYGVVF